MDYAERYERCLAAPRRTSDELEEPGQCRVYSRWVDNCGDCSFSYYTRCQTFGDCGE